MKIPILSSMPRALLWAFLVMFFVGAGLFYLSLPGTSPPIPEKVHEEYWTAFFLHGVAEFWGFALGILITFVIGIKLAEEKIKPILRFAAKLRENKVIEGTTARGVVMCAAKLVSEEKITKNLGLSINPESRNCGICDLSFTGTSDERCEHCGLRDRVWQSAAKDSAEV